jgi:hypothetical protein
LSTAAKLAVAILVVLGVLAILAGYTYLSVQARSLPSILGPIHGARYHRTKRGWAGLIGGAIFLLAALGIFISGRRGARTQQLSA